MDHVICSQCGYKVGLGMACEPGHCPECDEPLLHTSEFRALTAGDLEREVELQRRLEAERRGLPLV
jgi:transcription initiation factor IIE alpha subunit